MLLSSDLVSLLAVFLIALVGFIIAFAYRFGDKCNKYDEKAQTDELNEIRLAMRSESTVNAINKMWKFLYAADQLVKQGLNLDVGVLLVDNVRKEPFNKLINELDQTFRENENVKENWDSIKYGYSRLSKFLYVYAGSFGVACIVPLCLSLPSVDIIPPVGTIILWVVCAIIGIAFLIPIFYFYKKIAQSESAYAEKKKQYITDEVRLIG
jgi:hypothetical protein